MKKKIIVIFIITLLNITSLSIGVSDDYQKYKIDNNLIYSVVIDQSQEEQTHSQILDGYTSEFQTFKPSMSNIVKIELFIICPLYDEEEIIVELKEWDTILFESTIPTENLPHTIQEWVEFWTPNQEPIPVIPGSTYIIELTVPQDNRIAWGFSVNDPYSDGMASIDNSFDFCFRTFAIEDDNNPPDSPSIFDGPSEGVVGEEYTFATHTFDPENDSIFYLFDWGDGTNSDWLGPFDSGQLCSAQHAWENPGNYSIAVKAKDIWGDETEWVYALNIRIFDILGKKYALLVAPVRSVTYNNDETEFKFNIHQMRNILINNGWTDDNIIFLTRDDIALQAVSEPWIDGDATYENVEKALNALAHGGNFQFRQTDGSLGPIQSFKASNSIDKIFIEFRDHGGHYSESDRPPNRPDPRPGDEADGMDGCFKTYEWYDRSKNIENFFWDDELDIALDKIDYHWLVLQIDTCKSGEYIPDCSDSNRLIIASAREDESSSRYAYRFYDGIMNPSADGFAGGVVDGRISVEEAHGYCKWRMSNEGYSQTPVKSDRISGFLFLGPNTMHYSRGSYDEDIITTIQDIDKNSSSIISNVIINEMYYAAGDYNDPMQWVELFNKNKETVNLAGLELQFGLIDGSNIFPENISIPGLGYLVVTHDLEAFNEEFDVPSDVIVLDDDTMGNNLGASAIDTLFLLGENLEVIDHVDYGGGEGRAPAVEPPYSISRYKGGNNSGDSEEDWYAEEQPTPGTENNKEKSKNREFNQLFIRLLTRYSHIFLILRQLLILL
jgi:hypothetical protein